MITHSPPSETRGRLRLSSFASAKLGFTRLLNVAVAVYVLAIYLVSAVPGLSRTVHAAVGLMLFALLLRSVRHGLKLTWNPVVPLAVLFMSYALASVLWSINHGAALVSAIGLSVDVVGACLVLLAFGNGVSPRVVAVSAAVGASVQAVVSIDQYIASGAVRAEGLTGNANSLAIQLTISAFLLLLILPRSRWSQLLALAFIVVATITSGSRKMVFVWFSYAILQIHNLGFQLRRRTLMRASLLIGLPLIVWAAATYSPVVFGPLEELTIVQRVEGTFEGEETDKRSGLIADALQKWWQSPIVGHGIDQYRLVSEYSAYSHNNYTELLASLGVIGLVLYYLLFGVLFVKTARGVFRGKQAAWTVLAILIVLMLMDVARVSYTGRLTWLLIMVMSYYLQRVVDRPAFSEDQVS